MPSITDHSTILQTTALIQPKTRQPPLAVPHLHLKLRLRNQQARQKRPQCLGEPSRLRRECRHQHHQQRKRRKHILILEAGHSSIQAPQKQSSQPNESCNAQHAPPQRLPHFAHDAHDPRRITLSSHQLLNQYNHQHKHQVLEQQHRKRAPAILATRLVPLLHGRHSHSS